jgi:hypothetical protein
MVAADEQRDDLGVKDRTALTDAPDAVHEAIDVADPVLEQVARARGAALEELPGVGRFQVLRQDEHAERGVARAQGQRGAQAVVGVGGGHADVDHDDIGLVRPGLAGEVVRVGGHGDDVQAGPGQDAGDALAQQGGVFRHDDLHVVSPPCCSPAWPVGR